jgi:surfeit locus 1 family protein
MAADAPRNRSIAFLAGLVALLALAAAGFVALGVWQVQRLAWKNALIARVDQRIHAEPVAAPPVAQWGGITRENAEYRRVRATGRFDDSRQVLVRASTELGLGYWVLTPLRRDDGSWVLVNRGFVPQEQRRQVPAAPVGPIEVVGLLRLTEPGGSLLQRNDPASGRWYSRDVAVIAADRGLQGPVAPYFVDAQAVGGAQPSSPRPGLTVVQFPNNHLGYALTWFALAAGSLGALGFLLLDARRRRAQPGEQPIDARRPS